MPRARGPAMLARPMSAALRQAIHAVVAAAEPQGATMGDIVDHLAGEGFAPTGVEAEIWRMMTQRRLTPTGYVCRKVRRRDSVGEMELRHSYEFLLITWSPDADRQLDLALTMDEDEP